MAKEKKETTKKKNEVVDKKSIKKENTTQINCKKFKNFIQRSNKFGNEIWGKRGRLFRSFFFC